MTPQIINHEANIVSEYQEILSNRDNFKVTVVGKDPYPNDAIGIAFCKRTWEQFTAHNCSGQVVISSLGIDLNKAKGDFGNPIDFFKDLATKGEVAFLNASNTFIGGPIRKRRHLEELRSTNEFNAPIYRKSRKIILCGEAEKVRWIEEMNSSFLKHIHPDIRNSRNPKTLERWLTKWQANALASLLED